MENNNVEKELSQEELQNAKEDLRNELESKKSDTNEDIKLPSEEKSNEDEENTKEEPRVYAGVYKTVDELKKGITNLKSTLPQYVLDGMNEDALEQHYVELRKEFSSKGSDKKADETNKPNNVSSELWNELDATFNETGSITEEQYEKLEKAGIPKNVVDNYISGLEAQSKQFYNNLVEIAGGVEAYNDIKAWAEEKFTQEELDAITTGTDKEVELKLKGLKADYIAEVGTENVGNYNRLRGKKSQSNGYANQQEWLMDRKDKRYKSDMKYRQLVDNKFKNSSFAS